MSEERPHKVYKLLGRGGPPYCGVPAPWFFYFICAFLFGFFVFRAIAGTAAGVIWGILVGIAYIAAMGYQLVDSALIPLMILRIQGIRFPEETTSYTQGQQRTEWVDEDD